VSYTLTYEHPQFPQDYEFGINNLGLVKNGGSIEIDEDVERMFMASQGRTIEAALATDPFVTLSGSSALSQEERDSLVVDNTDNSSDSAVGISDNESVVADSTEPPPNESETTKDNEGVNNNG
jgi:hypothetical protein